jgi:hypothetical protein
MLELNETAAFITTCAKDELERSVSECLSGISRKDSGQVLISKIDNRDQLGVAAYATLLNSAKGRHCQPIN